MSTLKWVFDPIRPSGARQGGLATAHVIQPEIDNFVREVIQNAMDQRIDSQIVNVKFSLHRLSGERKEEFLDALNWGDLEQHITGASVHGGVTIGPQLQQALTLVGNGDLIILRIDDSGTKGLTGGEDDPSENFNLLCRNVLVTSEEREFRGGSFGLGKSVLWRFSMLSLVLFSSRILEGPGTRFRMFGRTELPFHRADGKEWDGPGWFGTEKTVGEGQKRAESVWGEDAEHVARKLQLFRPIQLGTGTSILVIGFFEPKGEETRDVRDIAKDLLASTARWFWPSLIEPSPTLKVSVEAYDNGNGLLHQSAENSEEIHPFVIAKTASETKTIVSSPGDVAEQDFDFMVPGKKPKDGSTAIPPITAKLTLRLRMAGTEDKDHRNSVALLRGSGMVVKYRDSKKTFGDQPYHAVLYGGLARGESEGDKALEQFLRASEPPSHNEWVPGTDRLRAEYNQGATARFTELWRKLDEAIIELCEETITDTKAGPQKLAELFPISGKGGGTLEKEKFRVSELNAYLEGEVWKFSGKVKCMSQKVPLWSITVGICLVGETGSGEYLAIENISFPGRVPVRKGKKWFCDVPEGTREIGFEGNTGKDIGVLNTGDLRRTKVKVEVRAHVITTMSALQAVPQ